MNHFLKDNEDYTDGHNVGIHEMAHAYYCQYIVYKEADNYFSIQYNAFRMEVAITLALEKNKENRIYTDNGLRNENEFWAESAELFFEKPNELKNSYPSLYGKISALLNQDLAE